MKDASPETIAVAEKILSRTLAYQAAIAVHELKDLLDLNVSELRLVVLPEIATEPGYRVVCTIEGADMPSRVRVEVVVRPDQAVSPVAKRTTTTEPNPAAKPDKARTRRRT